MVSLGFEHDLVTSSDRSETVSMIATQEVVGGWQPHDLAVAELGGRDKWLRVCP